MESQFTKLQVSLDLGPFRWDLLHILSSLGIIADHSTQVVIIPDHSNQAGIIPDHSKLFLCQINDVCMCIYIYIYIFMWVDKPFVCLKIGCVQKSCHSPCQSRKYTSASPKEKKRGREREWIFAKNNPFTIRLHPTLRDPLTLNAPCPAIVAQLRFKRQSYFPAVPRSKDGQPQHPTGWISED